MTIYVVSISPFKISPVHYLINCKGCYVTVVLPCICFTPRSIEVDATNRLCIRVQPVEFLRAEVYDKCCWRDETFSRRQQHYAIVSCQV